MSQRDVLAELRAARVAAPAEVRERVLAVAAAAPPEQKRFTWRRAVVVLVPVAAAVAAAVVLSQPTHRAAVTTRTLVEHGAVAGQALRSAASPKAYDALTVPTTQQRVQQVGTYLSLRTRSVSDGVKRAVRIASSLGGYAVSVHADLQRADLTLKVPRTHVQQAMTRLSALGTITSESVDIEDRTAGLNATDRLIARLRAQLRTATPREAPKLIARIKALQRGEAAMRRSAHYATVSLHLETPHAAVHKHHRGPLHGVGVALRWLGIGAVYALALGGPVALALVLVWLAVRTVRRRREDALLSRP
ncbi:MAG TPA: DUF4349 domain-containing protein [Gaiellaceae bacterium]